MSSSLQNIFKSLSQLDKQTSFSSMFWSNACLKIFKSPKLQFQTTFRVVLGVVRCKPNRQRREQAQFGIHSTNFQFPRSTFFMSFAISGLLLFPYLDISNFVTHSICTINLKRSVTWFGHLTVIFT